MNKKEILSKIKDAFKIEDTEEMLHQLESLIDEFEHMAQDQYNELLSRFLAEGGNRKDFAPLKDEEDKKFNEIINLYKERKKAFIQKKKEELEKNAFYKREIISELNMLIEGLQDISNIGVAFKKFNDLKDKWKDIGAVPKHLYKELQTEYSQKIEQFYYHVNIFKDLQHYDLKKNLELKKDLIERVKKLEEVEEINKLEPLIKALLVEWDEIGPTHQSDWESVRDEFREACNHVFERIKKFFKDKREKIKDAVARKTELCEQLEALAAEIPQNIKQANTKAKKLAEIQEAWKTAGFVGNKLNHELWERFKKGLDAYYAQKSAFHKELKSSFNEHKERKLQLIARAESMKTSQDWKNTTMDFVKLQNDWKRVGPCSQKDEQTLWKNFREQCNYFFEAKKQWFASMDQRLEENVQLKQQLITELESFTLSDNKEENHQKLKDFSQRWAEIGQVPQEHRNNMQNTFKKILDEKYSKLKIDTGEKRKMIYEGKLAAIQHAANSNELIAKEKSQILEKLKTLESEISQYENNLGFFKYTPDNNPMKKQVITQINTKKEELDLLKEKLKMIKAGV